MAMTSCDMRYGRTDEQKRKLASGLLGVISAETGEPADNIFFVVLHEHSAVNLSVSGQIDEET